MALVLQQNRLRWYGHVLRKEDNEWVKYEYEVKGPRPRGRPNLERGCRKVCQARKLNKEDAMDRSKWRNFIKNVR